MTDTDPEIAAIIHQRLMALTGSDRFMMGIRSCEAARQMVLASFPPALSDAERRRLYFQRVYGEPLPAGMERPPA
jgi:hypothetical protein